MTEPQRDGYAWTLSGAGWNFAGPTNYGSGNELVVQRFSAQGELDASWGNAGTVRAWLGDNVYLQAAALQADGSVLVAGRIGSDMLVARLTTTGLLDASFGTGGLARLDLSAWDDAESLALQADGRIVLTGLSTVSASDRLTVVRLTTAGALDTSFGAGTGYVQTSLPGSNRGIGRAVDVLPDGRLLVAAAIEQTATNNNNFTLVAYLANGALDTSFGASAGYTTLNAVAGNEEPEALLRLADGKFLMVGSATNPATGHWDSMLVRFNADGSIDTSFGNAGVRFAPVLSGASQPDSSWNAALQPDGRVLLVGEAYPAGSADFMVARLLDDGSFDTGFNTAGSRLIDLAPGEDDGAYSVAVDPATGRIVVVGGRWTATGNQWGIVGLRADGRLDTDFAASGLLGGTVSYTENGAPVVLDADARVFDTELSAANSFNGASLTLARQGGAHADDVFSATGTLSLSGGNLVLAGTTIGSYTNASGQLTFNFNANATQARVNSALQQIAYANLNDAPPASVQIDWTFDDGNSSTQGTGGALTTIGSTTVNITAVNDAPSGTDKTIPTNEDTAYAFTASDFGFTDVDSNTLSAVIISTLPSAGTLGGLKFEVDLPHFHGQVSA